MTEKEQAIQFCEDLLAHLRSDDGVTLRTIEKYPITAEYDMELKLVEGAMKTVGAAKVLGFSFELRLQVWDKEAGNK